MREKILTYIEKNSRVSLKDLAILLGTDEVIEKAIDAGADMLVTHHPLIMSGVTKITDDHFIGKRLITLIQHDISYYAMHTNYDVCGMADLAGEKLKLHNPEVLEVTGEETEGIGRIG